MSRPATAATPCPPIRVAEADEQTLFNWFGYDKAMLALWLRRLAAAGRHTPDGLHPLHALTVLQHEADDMARGHARRACDNPDYPASQRQLPPRAEILAWEPRIPRFIPDPGPLFTGHSDNPDDARLA